MKIVSNNNIISQLLECGLITYDEEEIEEMDEEDLSNEIESLSEGLSNWQDDRRAYEFDGSFVSTPFSWEGEDDIIIIWDSYSDLEDYLATKIAESMERDGSERFDFDYSYIASNEYTQYSESEAMSDFADEERDNYYEWDMSDLIASFTIFMEKEDELNDIVEYLEEEKTLLEVKVELLDIIKDKPIWEEISLPSEFSEWYTGKDVLESLQNAFHKKPTPEFWDRLKTLLFSKDKENVIMGFHLIKNLEEPIYYVALATLLQPIRGHENEFSFISDISEDMHDIFIDEFLRVGGEDVKNWFYHRFSGRVKLAFYLMLLQVKQDILDEGGESEISNTIINMIRMDIRSEHEMTQERLEEIEVELEDALGNVEGYLDTGELPDGTDYKYDIIYDWMSDDDFLHGYYNVFDFLYEYRNDDPERIIEQYYGGIDYEAYAQQYVADYGADTLLSDFDNERTLEECDEIWFYYE